MYELIIKVSADLAADVVTAVIAVGLIKITHKVHRMHQERCLMCKRVWEEKQSGTSDSV